MNKLIQATRIIDGMAVLVWAVFFGICMAGLAALNYSLIFGKPLMGSELVAIHIAGRPLMVWELIAIHVSQLLACLFIYALIASRIFRRMLLSHLRGAVPIMIGAIQYIIGTLTLLTLVISILWLPATLVWEGRITGGIIDVIFYPVFEWLGHTTLLANRHFFFFAPFALPVVAIFNELFIGVFLKFQKREGSEYKGPPAYALISGIILLLILMKLVFRVAALHIDSDAFIFIPLLSLATCAVLPYLFGVCSSDRQRAPLLPEGWQINLRDTFEKIRKRDFRKLSKSGWLIFTCLVLAVFAVLYVPIRFATRSQIGADAPLHAFIWDLGEDGVWLSSLFEWWLNIVLFVDRIVRYVPDVLMWGAFSFCHVFFLYRGFRFFRERQAWPDSEKWQELDKKIRPNFNSLFDKKPMILALLVFAGCMVTMVL